ncbi:MAG: universal stress protein [Candidatus Methanomethylophilaceae archaeon]|nr:universal stress protein [Candidatus Methanomethylophilaceae archaeon]
MFQKILLAVDGSVKNRAAVSKALSMAKESGGKVTAVFVEDIGYRLVPTYYSIAEIDETAQKVFSFVRSEAASMGVDVDYKVAIGHAAKDIANLSRDYDVVVCGTRGQSGVKRMVYGSVSEYLTKNASGTTVIVSD